MAILVPTGIVRGAQYENWDLYSYGKSTCSGIKDPFNFVFEGRTVGQVSQALPIVKGAPLNWSSTIIASDQWMWNSGESPGEQCNRNDYNRMSGATSPRNHTRLYAGTFVANVGWTTAAPMHHDDLSPCGDVADSFNSARNAAVTKYRDAGYVLIRTNIGNTLGIKQCDGRFTASDGYIYRNTGK
jgi:hypothetical protein